MLTGLHSESPLLPITDKDLHEIASVLSIPVTVIKPQQCVIQMVHEEEQGTCILPGFINLGQLLADVLPFVGFTFDKITTVFILEDLNRRHISDKVLHLY